MVGMEDLGNLGDLFPRDAGAGEARRVGKYIKQKGRCRSFGICLCSFLMLHDPVKQFRVVHTAICHGKSDMDELLVRAADANAVHFQK